jgi:phage terminase small subunit
MPRKAITKETIRNKTIQDMKKLGVYKPEYNRLIDIYAEISEQYERITAKFIKSKYKYEVETMQSGTKKAPIVATLETLRKDILTYSDRLCLNPKALETVTIEEGSKSKLAGILKELDKK